MLTFHINYYVKGQLQVLVGGPLGISDKESFNFEPIRSEEEWKGFKRNVMLDAENLASVIEKLPINKMDEYFVDEKYGTYYQNFQGLIEHTHYHLGQLVLIKQMVKLELDYNNNIKKIFIGMR